MKRVAAICMAVALAGCGVETVGTAATGAAIKQKEIEAGKKAMDQARQKVEEAAKLTQERAEKAE